MKIFVPKETEAGETRVPLIPETASKLVGLGAQVDVESGLGKSLGYDDTAYADQGASVAAGRDAALSSADMVLRLHPPPEQEIPRLRQGCIHISMLDPFGNPAALRNLARRHVTAICMELIPRTTLAQKMDAVSSQASLAGYAAVTLAAERLGKIFPMMMTPAGTIVPARVFVIGAGVAGLQAIATAKRLGARVDAFDTRPIVEEQVQSLGAKFVKIDLGETGQTDDGYAKQLSEAQLQKQREALTRICARSDVVITTALVFGKKAPVILTSDMIEQMSPGSVVIDLAAGSGGNVEGSRPDEEVDLNGVRLLGFRNLAGRVPVSASQMYSNNLGNLIEHFWNAETKTFEVRLDDDIMKGCLATYEGRVVNEALVGISEE